MTQNGMGVCHSLNRAHKGHTILLEGIGKIVGGLVASIIAFAVGAILDFTLTVSPDQHSLNTHTVRVVLMIVAVVGALLSLIGIMNTGFRGHPIVVDDDRGNVVRGDATCIEKRGA
jgi:hypothetical protein